MKISLITVVYNAQDTIASCIESVIGQNYPHIEYIIVDGGSTDNTLQIIDQYRHVISLIISEPDQGIYDAMNKGLKFATGQVVGTLNADDKLADSQVLSAIAQAFVSSNVDAVYGNLNFINQQGNITRKWVSGKCVINSFNWGFMPPHPTFYCRTALFKKMGFYSLEYGSAADYELMVRFMYLYKIDCYYLNKVLVHMLTGGVSNKSLKNRLKAWGFDLKAMRKNHIKFPLLTLLLKPLRKVYQFF
ncbi:glycosyltransferase family 2 protein [Mucilaginibacter dorajii]|uniref:Glycosyltransferase family 2 protein n=1 Tax=Mucilaginibacter dorajii TaxID=692994 RepID=A0ABP7Q2J4_9SPHI|nr:glycosyltransferase family 2 protein [Mucilaginibacter dorajii]MCS3732748.1 glycosyltransferase involved in cell wall biosynthesis [Mucilaginibacter dorajii]